LVDGIGELDDNGIHLLRKSRVLNQCKTELRVLLRPRRWR
jgi:hypothetical protein